MRRLLVGIFMASMFGMSASAQDEFAQSSPNRVGSEVVLRALDKVTAITEDFTVKVGDSLEYGSLRVEVKRCEKKPPEEIPATWAFLQIFDKRTDGGGENAEDEKVFSGWMLAERPAISALEHPVYDVWLLECVTTSRLR